MVILFLVIVFSGMGFGLVMPPFLFVTQNMGASPMLGTFILSTFAIGQFIATPIWGRLSDRYGRKPVLLITTLGTVLAYAFMVWGDLEQNIWLLLVGRLLTGLMSGNFAAATAYVTDITPPEDRAKGMGLVGGAVSLGFMLGPAVGGLTSGATAATASLLGPSLVAGCLSLLTFGAVLVFLPESLPPEKRAGRDAASAAAQPSILASLRSVMARPVLAPLVLVGLFMFLATANFEAIFALWTEQGFGWGPREVGFCLMYLASIVMVTQLFIVGRLAPLIGEGRVLQFAVLAYIFGMLFMATAPFAFVPARWELMVFGITFTAFSSALFNTAANSWVSKHAGDEERGTVLGLFQSAGWLGRGIGPTGSGFLFQTFGPNSPLYAAALVLVPVFLVVTLVRRRDAAGDAAS